MTDLISNSKVSIPRFPRIFAFIIDCIVLGVTGMVVGKSLYPYLENSPFIFQCIGTLICLFYFAALNSSIGQGKTIGKMACKIRVTNLMGFSISTFHSLIRSSILIIPLCFIGYLQQQSSNQLSITLLVALFQSIVFACFYLAIFNRNSQQSLHDVFSKTQILRNSQSTIPYHAVWAVHYYIMSALTVIIFAANLWTYQQNTPLSNDLKNQFSGDITNIQVVNQSTFIGEAVSNNQILFLNLSTPKYLNQQETAETLLQNIHQQHPDLFSSYKINKVNLNFAYQFGATKISRSKTYDLRFNQNHPQLEFSGENSATSFGF